MRRRSVAAHQPKRRYAARRGERDFQRQTAAVRGAHQHEGFRRTRQDVGHAVGQVRFGREHDLGLDGAAKIGDDIAVHRLIA
jgi:hypothetical protein